MTPAPDPIAAERQFYLDLLGLTSSNKSLAELRNLTGGGAYSPRSVSAEDIATESERFVEDRLRFNTLDLMPKSDASLTNISLATNRLVTRVFQAPQDMVATGVTLCTGNLAAVGQTEVRVALLHLGDTSLNAATKRTVFWPVARSDSDTSLFTTIDTVYSKPFSSAGGWNARPRLRKGEWYAAGVMGVGGTGPNMVGIASSVSAASSGVWSTGIQAGALGTPDSGLFGGVYGSSMAGTYLEPWMQITVETPTSSDKSPLSAVSIGDSFVGSYGNWIGRGNSQAGARLLILNNTGDGGNQQLTDVLSKISAHVAPYAPSHVLLHCGVNDISAGVSTSDLQARYTAVFSALKAVGVGRIIVCTPPPSSTFSGAQVAVLSSIRAWLLSLNVSGVTVVDTGIAMSTGDGVTSDAAKRVDAVHPNATGMQAMGDALDDVIATL